MTKCLRILGIRGVPAAHGGFETFAEHLARFLVDRDWKVIVYCQERGDGAPWTDMWEGIERIHIPVKQSGPLGTVVFDWKSVIHACSSKELCLTLGYNTAVFGLCFRLRGIRNVINMDGIEWSRAKWGHVAKAWFWMNDWLGCWLGDHLVADHPEIKKHLSTRVSPSKITTIAYGAEEVGGADVDLLAKWNLAPGRYLTLVARAEPENSVLEIVEGFSRKPRGRKLVVLGSYDPNHPYQRKVLEASGPEVVFVGPVYEKKIVQALRFYSAAYVHGHQVGGTNPSLVEALGAGNAVIAHDNRFNRWVAGGSARYFKDAGEFSDILDIVLNSRATLKTMSDGSKARFAQEFTWGRILGQYEELLSRFLDNPFRRY